MARKPKLDTDRRLQYALRCEVVLHLQKARKEPAKGFLPLSITKAAAEIGVDPRYFQMVEVGRRVPRYRKALAIIPWIHKRLGFDPVVKEKTS
jgi:hypothetical protein